ncbi:MULTISPECIES: hypothetical protein [Burkholderia]|uniref:hypothetical protein n=1 Tax=Burkholderia TaxID=32008 RepID=UPI000AAE73AA|nr:MULTISPECIES: hypothetical protein [Burkholderia]
MFDRMLGAIIDQTRNDGNIGVPARNAGRAGFGPRATAAQGCAPFARMRGQA